MPKFSALLIPLLLSLPCATRAADPLPKDPDLTRIQAEIRDHGVAYQDLLKLAHRGPRLCGSADEARAEQWALAKLKEYGADRSWLQPVQVPHWVRGDVERASVQGSPSSAKAPKAEDLRVTALGSSIGTPPGGIEGEVVEVHSLGEVDRLGKAVQGKIVFYNHPMDPKEPDSFKAYGKAIGQRAAGGPEASKWGALAVLVRSLSTLSDDDHPHTGGVDFRSGDRRIPSAALSTHAANILSKRLKEDPKARVHLELSARTLAPVHSQNVIGELRGTEHPDQYIDVGGHLDSWDLATGAMDDGAGVVQSLEILRSFHALGIRPKRTLRVVLFTCEEPGGLGGKEYARQAKARGEHHVLAIESDNGGFAPRGFGIEASPEALKKLAEWHPSLEAVHAGWIETGESDTDVRPLVAQGSAAAGLRVDPKHYFDYHHSSLDQPQVMRKEDVLAGAAAMATLAFLTAQSGL